MELRLSNSVLVLAALAVASCAKGGAQGASGASGGLNGVWTMGCTSQPGIAGLVPPSSSSYTSTLTVKNTSVSYSIQGFSDGGCQTASASITYNFSIATTGADANVPAAEDISLQVTSTSVCTTTCSSDGNIGTQYLGLFLINGNTLSVNWAPSRPTSMTYTFTQ